MPEKSPGLFSSPEKRNVIIVSAAGGSDTGALQSGQPPPLRELRRRPLRHRKRSHSQRRQLGHHHLGLFVHRAGELASAHLAVARARLSTVSPEPCRTPFHQRADSRRERRSSIFISHLRHWPRGAEFVRSGAIRASSHQCRIGGMGSGAQKRPQYVLLFRVAHRLLPVCTEARLEPVPGIHRLVCFGTDVEADGHHAPVCAPIAGLLAAGQDPGKYGRQVARTPVEACRREDTPTRPFRCQRGNHHARAARGWGRALHRAVLDGRAPGKCDCGLRHVFVEDDLAVPSGSHLSPSRRFAGGVAVGDVGAGARGRE